MSAQYKFLSRAKRLLVGCQTNRRDVRFLHIGKTAGSQISTIIGQINEMSDEVRVRKHGHNKYLKHLSDKSEYFFSIRHPVTRFYSGFYSRKRKGQPRNFREYSIYEEYAFAEFEHANDLAEALFEPGETGRKGFAAIKSILHTAQDQVDWIATCGAFLQRREPIFIIRQERFEDDLRTFFTRVGLAEIYPRIHVENDRLKSHANDYSAAPELSQKAQENLRAWYAQDLAFYDMCSEWIERSGVGRG